MAKLRPKAPAAPALVRWQLGKSAEVAAAMGAVAIASGVSLAFEILLTRLFSILFNYHYVFVATSIAICGLGFGAGLGAWLRQRGQGRQVLNLEYILPGLGFILLIQAILLPRLQSFGVYGAALLALMPYVFVGLFISQLFARRSEASGRLYAADLVGAAIGALAVLPLVSAVGAFAAIPWLTTLIALAGLILLARNRWAILLLCGLLAASTLVLIAHQSWNLLDLRLDVSHNASPDKTMLMVMQAQDARLVETVWGPFARLDVVETDDPSQKFVFTDAGAGSYMLRFDGDLSKLDALRGNVEYLPFSYGSTERTLVLGAGAGKDVLMALLAGSEQITAVEINPDMVTLTGRYRAYNGDILNRPEVTTIISDGRSFVEQADEHYDLVYLNVVYSQAAAHAGGPLAESYIFTEEAMRAYWRRLMPEGRIGLVTHNALEGSRAMLTALAMLRNEGLSLRQALDRVILFMSPSDSPFIRTSVLLVTRHALPAREVAMLVEEARQRGLQSLYVPGFFELTLQDLALGRTDVYEFARSGDYNLMPTSDDRPFFYHLNWELPASLTGLLLGISLVLFAYVALTLAASRHAYLLPTASLAAYFLLLGTAFMLVLLPLVQRSFLLLGNPTLALVVTLEGLLIGAGVGSFLSSQRQQNLRRLAIWAIGGVVLLLLGQALLYPWLRDLLMQTSLPVRIATSLALSVPLGMLLGVPFPTGLRIVGRLWPNKVSWFWGLNAVASVLGSVLAVTIAITLGFQVVLLSASVLYLVAGAVLIMGKI